MSSHREAPEISKDPVADSTDVYAFVSPDKPDTVTLIANYVPLQAPDGGPNFYEFGSDVEYAINIDNTGDGNPDVSYLFTFTSVLTNPKTFLYNTGPITITNGRLNTASWNRRQYFSVTKVVNGKSTKIASDLACPPCNIGPLSTPNYNDTPAAGQPEDFTKAFIYTLPTGETVFAGQRAEAFYVDLGAIFDLGIIRPIAADHATFGVSQTLANMPGVNSTAAVNVHSIAIQVPITAVTRGNVKPTSTTASNAVVGVWTTASRQTATIRNASGKPSSSGPFVQVSRLGNPLFNEVLVPLAQKDGWNAATPAHDVDYEAGVTHPELGNLLPVLYPGAFPNLDAFNKSGKPRVDLLLVLLRGIPAGVVSSSFSTQINGSSTDADMLRLNVAIQPATSSSFSNLGVLGNDVAGFPNGRRPADDVATIELKAVAGAILKLAYPTYSPDAAVGLVDEGLTSSSTDTTAKNSVKLLSVFPYLGTPHGGYLSPSTTPTADQQ